MKKRFVLILMAICCFFAPVFTSGCDKDLESIIPTKVLFLGNSLMYYNNMPQMFEQLAYADDNPLVVRSVTEGSATIRKFGNKDQNGTGKLAHYYLTKESWDYVVIEPSRRIKNTDTESTPSSDDLKDSDYTDFNLELDNALYLEKLVHEYNKDAKVVLYSVWGERKLDKDSDAAATINDIVYRKSRTELMYEANVKIAEALNNQIDNREEENKYEVSIIKAGHAFENYITNKENYTDNINYSDSLYHADNQHASLRGSYLAACTAYSTIFNKSFKYDKDIIKYDGNTTGTLNYDGNKDKDKYIEGKHYLKESTYKNLQKTAYETYVNNKIKVTTQKNALIIGSTSDSFGIRERNNLEKLINKNQDEKLNVYSFLSSYYSIENFTEKDKNDNYTLKLKEIVPVEDGSEETKEVTTELGFIYKNIKDFDHIIIQLPRYSSSDQDTINKYNNFKTILQNEVLINKLLNWTDNLYIMTLSSASVVTTTTYENDAKSIVESINNSDVSVISYADIYYPTLTALKGFINNDCENLIVNETKLKNVLISYILYQNLYNVEGFTIDNFKSVYGNISYTDMFSDATSGETDDSIDDFASFEHTSTNFTEVIYNTIVSYTEAYTDVLNKLSEFLCENTSVNKTKLRNVLTSFISYQILNNVESVTLDNFKSICGSNLSYTSIYNDNTPDDGINNLANMSDTAKSTNFTEVIYDVLFPSAS